MKNAVWISISFSLLSTLAQASEVPAVTGDSQKNSQARVSQETCEQIQKLNIHNNPPAEQLLPCVASRR